MLVYKFGGVSIKDANRIRSILPLIKQKQSEPLVLVISALGKMTNAFELLLDLYRKNSAGKEAQLNLIKAYHIAILDKLFKKEDPIFKTIDECFAHLQGDLALFANEDYDFAYDQLVTYGELLSSKIISAFLLKEQISNTWADASKLLITNDKYRDARLDWTKSHEMIRLKLKPVFQNVNVVVTQGFMAGNDSGKRTSLGREGSDFSAAILAHMLDAEALTVWKDVPGIRNADPRLFSSAKALPHISYHETVELAFYGASVIHPRSLQPLKLKRIPLYVRSFENPEKFTLINGDNSDDKENTSYIIRENQILFSIASFDFSFIDAENLTAILKLFSRYHFHIRLLQNSALNFSLVADENPLGLQALLDQLQKKYSVKYNRNLSLLSVRHFKNEELNKLFRQSKLLLEMHSRITQQFVLNTEELKALQEELEFYVCQ
jgi:aspartate kinase